VERHLAEQALDVHGAPGQRRYRPGGGPGRLAIGTPRLDVGASRTRTVEYGAQPADADGMFTLLVPEGRLGSHARTLAGAGVRAGRGYLDRYRLSNTETTDLWGGIESDGRTRTPDHGFVDLRRGSVDPAGPRPDHSNASPTPAGR
jgi:hypothetical protein